MDHYFFGGGGDVRNCPKKIPAQQKMLKNGTRETMGKNFWQVLSTIIIMLKNYWCTSYWPPK